MGNSHSAEKLAKMAVNAAIDHYGPNHPKYNPNQYSQEYQQAPGPQYPGGGFQQQAQQQGGYIPPHGGQGQQHGGYNQGGYNQMGQSHSGHQPDEYTRLRSMAHQEAGLRSSCYDRSKQAYSHGDGAQAKQLSDEGHQHDAQMNRYNAQAAEWIFNENNQNIPPDQIDLHGLYVQESIEYTERKINWCKANNMDHLHVIVGKGIHSVDHIQKLKPAIEQLMAKHHFACTPEHNAGRLYIEFGKQGNMNWMDDLVNKAQNNDCVVM